MTIRHRTSRSRRRLSLCRAAIALTAMLAACSDSDSQPSDSAGPALPPLELKPMVATLEQLRDSLPTPDAASQKTLADYADVALQRVEADGRTAALAERALLEHESAWFVLEPALADESISVRRRAAWLCGRSGQSVLQLPLVLRLKYELDPETTLWVADAILRLGNDCAFAWLDAAIDRAETAQQAGQMAIAALAARGVELPEQPSWEQLREAIGATLQRWRETGRSAVTEVAAPDPAQLEARLARRLLTPNSFQLRPVDDARFILRNCGVLCVPMMARAIHAEEHYIRTMPLQELARLGAAAHDASERILPLLGDPLTASYAVRALGEIGAHDALPWLRPLLDAVDTELRTAAVQALGVLGDEASRARLAAMMADEQESMDVRVGAAFGLLCLGEHSEAEHFLSERERLGDYHEPTLRELRERLQARVD